MTTEPTLEAFNPIVGTWTTKASHPASPGVVVHGTVKIEWLEGERFLMHRARTDHPDFSDSISIIGFTERDRIDTVAGAEHQATTKPQLTMHYFDSRGVFRVYSVSIDEQALRIWRDAPGFSQRFTGSFDDGLATIDGLWQVCEDDRHWNDDLQITYRRA
jgi:hypothetical protein